METKLIPVLLIERDLKFTRFLRESLSSLTSAEIELFVGETLAEALQKLRGARYDAILLDLCLSDSEGTETFERIHAAAPMSPIVILTCHEDEAFALEALRKGAQEYLLKSKIDGRILTRVVRYAIERKRIELKLVAANSDLLKSNHDLARSEEALRRALEEVRAANQRLKATQLQLIQAAKMECVGTLAAGVAHEVKNPLQTILMGLAYLAKNIPTEDQTLVLALNDMRDAVRRADAIVRDLLYLSAARQIEMRRQNLNTVLDRSLLFVNYDLIRSRVLVFRDLQPDLPMALVDEAKMEQVLINLFMNAIQAMPNGGNLILRTRLTACDLDAAPDVLNKFQPGERLVTIEVEDTGVGIPEEKAQRVFEPFFTTKPNGIGTGLGLPVSKQIVDMHGGLIKLCAGPRGGARATVILKAVEHEKETNLVG
ncbi:MAG TPA: ATP-binding protein [Verrucomicrobiae bacterium]